MEASSPSSYTNQLFLITGANRGLGYHAVTLLAKQPCTIILAARTLKKAQDAVASISKMSHKDCTIIPFELEMSNAKDRQKLFEFVQSKFGYLDCLIQNAAMFVQDKMTPEITQQTILINVLSVLELSKVLMPLLKVNKGAKTPSRIVNVSSELGRINKASPERQKILQNPALTFEELKKLCAEYVADCAKGGDYHQKTKGWPKNDCYGTYGTSKIFLNLSTQLLAADNSWLDPSVKKGENDRTVLVNCLHPGWCATDMGGSSAPKAPVEGGRDIYIAATRDLYVAQKKKYLTGLFWSRLTELEF